MLIAAIAISVVIGFVVAAGVVGSQAQRLGRQPREPVWRLNEAAEFVSQHLPFEAAAWLSNAELEALLRGHLNQLQFDDATDDVDAEDGSDAESATVNEDRKSVAALYRTMRQQGLEVSLDHVAAAVDAHLEYLRRIGALAAVTENGS